MDSTVITEPKYIGNNRAISEHNGYSGMIQTQQFGYKITMLTIAAKPRKAKIEHKMSLKCSVMNTK